MIPDSEIINLQLFITTTTDYCKVKQNYMWKNVQFYKQIVKKSPGMNTGHIVLLQQQLLGTSLQYPCDVIQNSLT